MAGVSEGSLEGLFDDAAALAGRVPTSMQAAAFEIAVERLTATKSSASTGSVRSPAGRRSRIGSTTRPATGRPGPKAAVESLLDGGYLDDPRVVGDIRDYLTSRGWKYAAKEVATAVLRLLREGRLARTRRADGQYQYQRAGSS